MTRFALVIATTAFVLAPAQAAFVVIDFDALTDPTNSGLVGRGLTHTEDGFTLTALTPNNFGFRSIHAADYRYTGTPSFFSDNSGGTTRLTRISGVPFTLFSIDLDALNRSTTVSVTFSGSLTGGGTVTQAFTTDATVASLQTFTFHSSFTNLTAVEWNQVTPFHSFDNIVAGDAAAVATPAPPTALAALIVPLVGLVGRFRRRAV